MAGRRRKPRRLYVGIDPGKEGFICVVDSHGDIVAMRRIPYDERGRPDVERIKVMFKILKAKGAEHVLIEQQHVFPKQGAVSAWTLAAGYYCLITALSWSGLSYEIVTAAAWKRDADIPEVTKSVKLPKKPATKKGLAQWRKECAKLNTKAAAEAKKQRKALAMALAQRLQPNYDFRLTERKRTPHDGKCESFLLARVALERARKNARDEAA